MVKIDEITIELNDLIAEQGLIGLLSEIQRVCINNAETARVIYGSDFVPAQWYYASKAITSTVNKLIKKAQLGGYHDFFDL